MILQNISKDGKQNEIKNDRKLTENYDDAIPSIVTELMKGCTINGSDEININTKPKWLDEEKFKKGQKFAVDNFVLIAYSQLMSLFAMFINDSGLNTLIFTGASNTPYKAFTRYLSTINRFYNWVTSDPWLPGTEAHRDICYVRWIHDKIKKKLSITSDEEFAEKITIQNPWCPALKILRNDFQLSCHESKEHLILNSYLKYCPDRKIINQTEMAMTQFALTGLILLKPKECGLHHVLNEDLEAFCHVWRVIGYLIGIDDRFNFCRGTLADVNNRSKEVLEYLIKPNFQNVKGECEHMMRCAIEGLTYYIPGWSFSIILLHFAEILNIPMPQLYKSLSYFERIKYITFRFVLKYITKIYGFNKVISYYTIKLLKRAIKFDVKKHQKLKNKSLKTLEVYST